MYVQGVAGKHTVTTCILSQVKATEMHIAVSVYLEHTFSHHLFCNIHVSSVYLPRVLISQVIQPHAHFKHSKMSQATTKISLTSLHPWGLFPPPLLIGHFLGGKYRDTK